MENILDPRFVIILSDGSWETMNPGTRIVMMSAGDHELWAETDDDWEVIERSAETRNHIFPVYTGVYTPREDEEGDDGGEEP